MTRLNELTSATALSGGDKFPVFSQAEGETLASSLSLLLAFLQDSLNFSGPVETLRNFTPATGATVAVNIGDQRDLWIALAPAGTLAALTIDITGAPQSMQEIAVSSSAAVTALTVTADQPVQGDPASMVANGFFRLKYDGVNSIWRRVG